MRGSHRGRRVVGRSTPQTSTQLYLAELPPVDVMVRTSGERRISNFLLWQSAAPQVYFTDRHGPTSAATELDAAIAVARAR